MPNTKSQPVNLTEIEIALSNCLLSDRAALEKLVGAIRKRQTQKLPLDKLLQKAKRLANKSQSIVRQRQILLSQPIEFNSQLPIVQEKDRIAKLIEDNQVLVVAGETGSGKTTQLPKICMELGLGIKGQIGHTQPRRVAATSVARRIAEELKSELGQKVGYSIRFNDQTNDVTPLRLMTDGVLLNEIHSDPLLLKYDCIIIDEAHERSLNIDFLLGYLRELLVKRHDLKIIITSATIDLERFAKHFSIQGKPAPIIEVSGRTYPVDVWYREADEENPLPQLQQIGHAVEELMNYSAGDILIFLSGEAEIRETAKLLRKDRFNQCEVLPLYARLSISEQEKIFKVSGGKRRIVLATNVAETSITVPGIRFVIDSGFARISRYSVRHKIQRLPIEKISQASANQRKGRCGRVADGICVRLYSEEDFNARSKFTDAEILRTNLASVILQMQQSGLGLVEDFPFIDMPADKQISDGINLLLELQAIDKDKRLTKVGRRMAKLPIEPRLARILVEGQEQEVLADCLVIAAFLSVKDPREWPFDKRELAQQKHRKFQHSQSDFIVILNLWRYLHEQQAELTNRLFRQHCQQELINFNAYREWKSTYRQLKSLMLDRKSFDKKRLDNKNQKTQLKVSSFIEDKANKQEAAQYQHLHQALLSGFLSFVGQKDIEKGYQAARQSKYFVHPQSVNFKKQPAWLMAFEVVETTQAYARLTAFIEPVWLETSAKHLLKTHYYEPFWSKSRGAVLAAMQQTLFGLKVVLDRKIDYSNIDPEICRQLFLLHGLVRQELNSKQAFFLHNQKIMAEVEQEVAKARQADLHNSESDITRWFDQQLPKQICNLKQLNLWLKQDSQHQKSLQLTASVLIEQTSQDKNQYPEKITVKGIELSVAYHFEPGHQQDGVTVKIPASLRNKFVDKDFERLVPGLLPEKIEYMLRSMPKRFRKNFVPIPQFANACYEQVTSQSGGLVDIISKHLYRMTGVILTQEAWNELNLPEHFLMRFELIDDKNNLIFSGRTLEQQNIKTAERPLAKQQVSVQSKADKLKNKQSYQSWNFDFKRQASVKEAGTDIPIYYAVEDAGLEKVRLIHSVSQRSAEQIHLRGVCRLILLANKDETKYFIKSYRHKSPLALAATGLAQYSELLDMTMLAVVKDLIANDLPFNKEAFQKLVAEISPQLVSETNQVLDKLLKTLKTRAALLAELKRLGKNYQLLKEDLQEQLDYLFEANFLYRYGVKTLTDYQRYLLGAEKRLARARQNLSKEAQLTEQINPWLDKRIEIEEESKYPLMVKNEFLAMLEEFRISLFAQGQKTRFPISAKRLQKFAEQLESKYL